LISVFHRLREIAMKQTNGDISGLQCVVYSWLTLVVGMLVIAIWQPDISMAFRDPTAVFLALFGIHVVRILKSQQKTIMKLEDKLLRLTTPSPFAHVLPMTNDE